MSEKAIRPNLDFDKESVVQHVGVSTWCLNPYAYMRTSYIQIPDSVIRDTGMDTQEFMAVYLKFISASRSGYDFIVAGLYHTLTVALRKHCSKVVFIPIDDHKRLEELWTCPFQRILTKDWISNNVDTTNSGSGGADPDQELPF